MMNRLRRFFSRISFRLMAFNLLLVFLPIGAILVLGTYEVHLLETRRESLLRQGRVIAAAIRAAERSGQTGEELLRDVSVTDGEAALEMPRIRILGEEGEILADSQRFAPAVPTDVGARISPLDRWMGSLAQPLVRMLRPSAPLESEVTYEAAGALDGAEVVAAQQGRIGYAERLLENRGVMMYVAIPIASTEARARAVLLTQSTIPVLEDLDAIRAGIVRIFLASIVLALLISFLVATTIVSPLRKLRRDATRILDRRGGIRTRFHGSAKADEIGDLARSLERLTTRLESHVRFIESFASDVSHEFRNPLASVRTATEMLAETDEPEERERFRRMIEREIARMETMIAGVREASLVDALMTREETHPVPLEPVLARVVERQRQQAPAGVRIATDAGAKELWIEGREERLEQVLDNLVGNAVSFSPFDGTVQVHAFSEDEMVVIRVSDEGPGVPEVHREKIFERFFTWRPGMEGARARHTGLGLAIVRGIVEGYGGSVELVTREEGPGATFEVRLPVAEQTGTQESSPVESRP